MQRNARHDREWEQWPGRGTSDDRRGRLRDLFAPSDATDAVTELIAERGKELEERSAQIRAAVEALEHREQRARDLHFRVEQVLRDGAAELDLRQAELSVRSTELDKRETALEQMEARVEDRRRTLGAVELRAATVERREDAVRLRERQLEQRAGELERRAGDLAELTQQLDELRTTLAASGKPAVREDEHVALVVGPTYRLIVRPGPAPVPGGLLELEESSYRCVSVTRSPLPSDDRRCALIEPVRPG